MAYRIIWTKNAREDLKAIIKYLKEEWSLTVAEKFIIDVYQKIDLISNFPFSGIKSFKNKSVRKIVITRHNSLYYKIEEDKIRLLDFFDNRQDLEKDVYS